MTIDGGTPVKRIAVAAIASGIADSPRPCHFCKVFTVRVIAWKTPPTAPMFAMLWACDYCVEAIRTMEFRPVGL